MSEENIKLRNQFYEINKTMFFNHGSKGTQLKISPLRKVSPLKSNYTASRKYKEELRKEISRLIHSDQQEIAILDSVTTALNSAIFGLPSNIKASIKNFAAQFG